MNITLIANSIACIVLMVSHRTFCMDNQTINTPKPKKIISPQTYSVEFYTRKPDGYYSLKKKLSLESVNPRRRGYFLIIPASSKELPFLKETSSSEDAPKITIAITDPEINEIKKTPLYGVNRGTIVVKINDILYPIISIDDQREKNLPEKRITTSPDTRGDDKTSTVDQVESRNKKPDIFIQKKLAQQKPTENTAKKPQRSLASSYRNLVVGCSASALLAVLLYMYLGPFNFDWSIQLFKNAPADIPIQ